MAFGIAGVVVVVFANGVGIKCVFIVSWLINEKNKNHLSLVSYACAPVACDAMSLLNDNSAVVASSPSTTLKPYSTVVTSKTNTTAVKMDKNDPVMSPPVAIANQPDTATAVVTQKTEIGRIE